MLMEGLLLIYLCCTENLLILPSICHLFFFHIFKLNLFLAKYFFSFSIYLTFLIFQRERYSKHGDPKYLVHYTV